MEASKQKLGTILGILTVVVALALAPVAFAQSSAVETYGGEGSEVALVSGGDGNGTSGDPSGATAGSSALPFTGLDVGLLAGGGLILLLLGLGMARMVSRERQA